MSFILDALKKAEAERNRRIAPVLMDARVAPPKRGLPAWGWLLGAVLVANLAVLGWLLARGPAVPATASPPGEAAGLSAMPVQGPPATGTAAAGTLTSAAAPAAIAAAPSQATPVATPASTTSHPTSPAVRARADADSDLSLPALHELRTAGITLPELVLNLHVYDPAPAYRWVMLNGIRLREGEYTPNGVKVERITPSGVVLEAAGRRFRLDAGGG
jgi:general secretion pathway protein B